jgi:hypothetical protein|tara:strand:- start:244 stop:603 length:360 start_codon:yes stop_codon:yes gene_type:complete
MKPIESMNQLKRLASHPDGVEVCVRLNNGAMSGKTVKYFETPQPATNEAWGPDKMVTDVFWGKDYMPMGACRSQLQVHWSVWHDSSESESEHTNDLSLYHRTFILRAIGAGSLFLVEEN